MTERKKRISIPLQVSRLGVRKWLVNPRMYMVFLLLAVFEWTLIQDVRRYAVSVGLSVSCCYFPFLFSKNINSLFIYLALVLMFCNAPYVDRHQIYLMIRTGRKKWFLGQILYTAAASFLFFAGAYIISLLEFVPYVGFSTEWGSVLSVLSQNPRPYINIPYDIIQNYTPWQALLLCFCINVCVGIMLGLLIFYVNLWKSRGYGAAVALGWVALSDLVIPLIGYARWLVCLAPTTWGNLTLYSGNYSRLNLRYVWAFLLTGIVLLATLIMIRAKSYSVEAMEEI